MLDVAAAGAAIAAAVVLVVAAFIRKPLTAVPENTLKFAVGLMLVTFGTFWAGEGLGIDWPGEDVAILAIFAGYLALSLLATRLVGRQVATLVRRAPAVAPEAHQ
jgi:uncharacterized membrane protein